MKKSILISFLILILCYSSTWAYEGENLFIINWDGMRYDAIDDSIPKFLVDSLSQQGIFFTNLNNAWHTFTSPGHANIHTGNPQYCPNHFSQMGSSYAIHYLPSLMETLVRERGGSPQDSVLSWVFGNCANDWSWGYSRHPDYPDSDPSVSIHAARKILEMPDEELWEQVIKPVLDEYQPDMFYVDFHKVDTYGHKIDPENPDSGIIEYNRKIEIVDSITWVILNDYIPNHPKYRNKTNVLITSDHGRHTDGVNNGIAGHGCDCDGCRHVAGLLWGPDFRNGLVVDDAVYQTDFAHTFAHLLGLKAPHARTSKIRYEWLKNPEIERWLPQKGGGSSVSDPEANCSYPDFTTLDNGKVYSVWCEDDRAVVCGIYQNGIWSQRMRVQCSDSQLLKTPRITAKDSVILVCWETYKVKCSGFKNWYLEMTSSYDGGTNWTPITDAISEVPSMYADIDMGEDEHGPFAIVGICHGSDCGTKYLLGDISILKGRPSNIWNQRYNVPLGWSGAQQCAVTSADTDFLVSTNSFWTHSQNYEIIDLISFNNGKTWMEPFFITEDAQSDYYKHDYFPSSLIVEAIPQTFGRSVEVKSSNRLVNIHPNPFNSTTRISLNLRTDGDISLEVFNLLGQKVATIVEGFRELGKHTCSWDASEHSSGVYLYKLTFGDEVITGRMTLLK
ncbi:MAG: T9SS type A sorting domain-containing protein [candidate division Zixibacteria bacterium]|nr:T9SS type A sorting domain-containing protein [candidate division Zixibacteria bacterium]